VHTARRLRTIGTVHHDAHDAALVIIPGYKAEPGNRRRSNHCHRCMWHVLKAQSHHACRLHNRRTHRHCTASAQPPRKRFTNMPRGDMRLTTEQAELLSNPMQTNIVVCTHCNSRHLSCKQHPRTACTPPTVARCMVTCHKQQRQYQCFMHGCLLISKQAAVPSTPGTSCCCKGTAACSSSLPVLRS
jgi:hypothetical protein